MGERLPHHYAALGVPVDASDEDVRRAIREGRTRWHPDALGVRGAPSGQTRFVAVGDAAAALGTQEARAAYDQALQAGLDALLATAGQPPLLGLIDRLAGVRKAPSEAGRNRRLRLTVAFEAAVTGTARSVELDTTIDCQTCDGAGFSASGRPWVCARCAGLGETLVRGTVRSAWERCRLCRGRGFEIEGACATCEGRGTRLTRTRFTVPVPAGTASGTILRVAGAGEPSESDGPPGDLLVEVFVEPDRRWRLDGVDLRMERWVPFWRAAAGGGIALVTPHGAARVQIPPGLADGEVLRLPGWGIRRGDKAGDLYATIRLEWPRGLTPEARAELVKWASSLPEDVFPRSLEQDRETREVGDA